MYFNCRYHYYRKYYIPGAYAGDDFTKGCTDNTSGASIGVTDKPLTILHGPSGDDGGSGFDAWSISTTGTSGYYLGNPGNDGMGTTRIERMLLASMLQGRLFERLSSINQFNGSW